MGVLALSKMQEMLFAQDKCPVLFIFQAIDAAGKDGAIRHVMSGVNPRGARSTPLKHRRLRKWTPEKHWNFYMGDATEPGYWKDCMSAYENMIRNTSTPHAPWFVVPADNKWYTWLIVAAVIDGMNSLKLHFPEVRPEKQPELAKARRALLAE